jgi:hypothetical protein
MDAIIRFFKENETWIYVILGVLALVPLRNFIQSWAEFSASAFGMERDAAQAKLNLWAILLVLLLAMAVFVFVLVTYVAPSMPGAAPFPTATLDLLATASNTPASLFDAPAPIAGTSEPTATVEVQGQGCTPGQVVILSPQDGETISGVVVVRGTAEIQNFGFYKYEIARPGESIWLSLNAGETPVREDVLGEWVTSVLPPGEYRLRLMVADNQGKYMPACTIQVIVAVAPEP